jgi:RNA recognition motif-containing protein
MNIYVGNLSLDVTEEELRKEFQAFGEVISVTIMNDRYIGSGQSRGYAFIEMASLSEGKDAINSLHGKPLNNMTISAVEALPLSKKDDTSYINKKNKWAFSKIRHR